MGNFLGLAKCNKHAKVYDGVHTAELVQKQNVGTVNQPPGYNPAELVHTAELVQEQNVGMVDLPPGYNPMNKGEDDRDLYSFREYIVNVVQANISAIVTLYDKNEGWELMSSERTSCSPYVKYTFRKRK